MPVVKINTGAKASKPAARKTAVKAKGTAAKASTPKTAKATTAKRTTAKSTSAKPKANTAKTAVKRGAKAGAAKTAKSTTAAKPKVDQRTLDSQVKKLSKIGKDRKAAELKHKELVDKSYEAAQEALAKGVPVGVVAESLQISRQWLYKIGNYSGRS